MTETKDQYPEEDNYYNILFICTSTSYSSWNAHTGIVNYS